MTRADHTRAHSILVAEIEVSVGARPDVRLWPQRFLRHVQVGPRHFSVGREGMSDLGGILTLDFAGEPLGVDLEIEVKTGRATLEPEQRSWRDMIVRRGGLFVEGRSVDQVHAEIDAFKTRWDVRLRATRRPEGH